MPIASRMTATPMNAPEMIHTPAELAGCEGAEDGTSWTSVSSS